MRYFRWPTWAAIYFFVFFSRPVLADERSPMWPKTDATIVFSLPETGEALSLSFNSTRQVVRAEFSGNPNRSPSIVYDATQRRTTMIFPRLKKFAVVRGAKAQILTFGIALLQHPENWVSGDGDIISGEHCTRWSLKKPTKAPETECLTSDNLPLEIPYGTTIIRAISISRTRVPLTTFQFPEDFEEVPLPNELLNPRRHLDKAR